jgi:hypothetical protein
MSIIGSNILAGASGQAGYNLNNSLRLRFNSTASSTSYLSRTNSSSPTNNKIGTLSFWIKRGIIGSQTGNGQYLIETGTGASDSTHFSFVMGTNDVFSISQYNVEPILTTRVFRDPAAWYHIVFVFDSTQGTAADRYKLYINGVLETGLTRPGSCPLNSNWAILNSSQAINIGRHTLVGRGSEAYLAEWNLIDGQALTPSSFGETDTTTGSWKPKAYTGTYGTNGFYLKFSDIATTSGSNAGLGKDFSGNANYWTTNNISVTAGVTYDAMIDSPTNTSATVANYCVLNPINLSTSSSTSNANLRFTNSAGGSSWRSVGSTIAPTSGKWYWEGVFSGSSGSGGIYAMIGVFNPNNYFITNYTASTFWDAGYAYYGDDGFKRILGAASSYGSSFTNGDTIGLALDLDSGTLTCYKNNVSQGVLASGLSGPLTPAFANFDNNATVTANFGQRPFTYTPPTGFVRLNAYNLPDSTIKKGNTVMDATLYTGTNASQSITNAGAFKPDFVWVKSRSVSGNPVLVDSVRGANKVLYSPQTTAEETPTVGTAILSFNSNGFSLGGDISGTSWGSTNGNTFTYVGWQWQAGQGTNTSNTSGSITSTVSVNTTAGFSIVTYTGNSTAGATIGHGLGVAPSMIFTKTRSSAAGNWGVYHKSIGATQVLNLNLTAAAATSSAFWNNTAPTSSVFTVATSNDVNASATTYVAYCWAEIAGFSKFGSYLANASADGPFIYTGFRPKYILIKGSVAGNNWVALDTSRSTYNQVAAYLLPNLSNAEATAGNYIDILSNGFKIRDSGSDVNYSSGATYIYMAFAENPFKNANAR